MSTFANNRMKGKRPHWALAFVALLMMVGGCSRHEEPTTPVVSAAERSLPVPVEIPPDAPVRSLGAASAQQVVPAEERLEPVSIDDASVPSESAAPRPKPKKK